LKWRIRGRFKNKWLLNINRKLVEKRLSYSLSTDFLQLSLKIQFENNKTKRIIHHFKKKEEGLDCFLLLNLIPI